MRGKSPPGEMGVRERRLRTAGLQTKDPAHADGDRAREPSAGLSASICMATLSLRHSKTQSASQIQQNVADFTEEGATLPAFPSGMRPGSVQQDTQRKEEAMQEVAAGQKRNLLGEWRAKH